jgi:hypothetical protein
MRLSITIVLTAVGLISTYSRAADESVDSHVLHHREDNAEPTITAEFLWESRYVTEGTNILPGSAIASGFVSAHFGAVHLDMWQALGLETNYSELNVMPVWDFSSSPVGAYLSYNHKRFFSSNTHDHEFGYGLSFDKLPWDLELHFDGYYSLGLRGAYNEFSLHTHWTIGRIELRPSIALGINAHYVADHRDGLHSIIPRLDVKVPLNGGLSLIGYAAGTVPFHDEADRFAWFGVGVGYEW